MFETSLKVLEKIESHGYKAYIVGGFVRDYILGIESTDVDISTNATPKELLEIFNESALPNEEYGAVTLFYKNNRYEITTFRREIVYINNRKPVEIEYIDDLVEDLKRRDFRMNTLCIDKLGNVLDYFDGKKDIENKVINTVGNSNYKFSQDSLRILRAIRFATSLNFSLSDEVKDAIIENKHLLKTLSYSRKKQEVDKIFLSNNARYGVDLLIELGLDQELEIYNLDKIILCNDIISIWASLDLSDKYKQEFSSSEKEIIKDVKEVLKIGISNYSLYKYGLYANQIASNILGVDKSKIVGIYESLPIKSRKDILISSKEIEELLNIKPGPFFKEIYEKITIEIINNKLKNDNEKIKEYILNNNR